MRYGGRQKGTPNKVTKEAKAILAQALQNNIQFVEKWIQDVSLEDPAKAVVLVLKLAEFVVPKLTKVDGSSVEREPLCFQIVDEEGNEIFEYQEKG